MLFLLTLIAGINAPCETVQPCPQTVVHAPGVAVHVGAIPAPIIEQLPAPVAVQVQQPVATPRCHNGVCRPAPVSVRVRGNRGSVRVGPIWRPRVWLRW